MKANKLTKGSNLFWESSRMFLPEHKEAYLQHRVDVTKKEKPILDEQRVSELARTIATAIFTEKPVKLTVFDVFEDIELEGKIEKIDTHQKQIKIQIVDGFEWIKLENILEMSIEGIE